MSRRPVRTADDAEVASLLGLEPLDRGTADEQHSQNAQVGQRVRQARQRAGLAAAVVAEQAGLTPDKLSKIENGRRRVALGELPALADALHVPVSALLGTSDATPLALALAHRVAATAPDSASSGMRARAVEILEAEVRLGRAGGLPPRQLSADGAAVQQLAAAEFSAMPRTAPEAQRQGRSLAEKVRRVLDLGIAAVGDLAGLIEMHLGADVALSPLGEGSDGLCAHDGEAALIVANTDVSAGRTRFTLAHELGHHLLRDPRSVIDERLDDMLGATYVERRVNAFAGHLLLPVRAVEVTLRWLGCSRDDLAAASTRGRAALGYLMAAYGVSMPCALMQLVEAGILTTAEQTDLAGRLQAAELLRTAEHLLDGQPGPDKKTHQQRPPARLVTAALEAARAGRAGMNTVAVLLGRPDDDVLFEEVMYPDAGASRE